MFQCTSEKLIESLSNMYFLHYICLLGEDGIGRGTLRFVQNDQTSSSFSAGIVQVYVDGTWGGICSNNDFGQTEANVICHQFGYSAAASYSTVGNLDRLEMYIQY